MPTAVSRSAAPSGPTLIAPVLASLPEFLALLVTGLVGLASDAAGGVASLGAVEALDDPFEAGAGALVVMRKEGAATGLSSTVISGV